MNSLLRVIWISISVEISADSEQYICREQQHCSLPSSNRYHVNFHEHEQLQQSTAAATTADDGSATESSSTTEEPTTNAATNGGVYSEGTENYLTQPIFAKSTIPRFTIWGN